MQTNIRCQNSNALRGTRLLPAAVLSGILILAAAEPSHGQAAKAAPDPLQKASRALQSGDLATAEKLLLQVLKISPEQPVGLNMLGYLRVQQKRPEEARDLFERAIKANPKYADPYTNLGILYQTGNDSNRAFELLNKAQALAPRDPRVLYNLALLLGDRGEFGTAVERLKAIPQKDRPAGYWDLMARLCVTGNLYEPAEEALKHVLARNPESIAILRQLAGVALKRNNSEAAWRYMLQARDIAPNSPELLFQYAQVSLANQLAAEAIVAMRKALLIEPDRPEYLLLLGKSITDANALVQSHMEFGDPVPFLKRYLELKPDDPQGHSSLGWAFYLDKDYANARREIEESLRLQPNQALCNYQLGLIAYDSGENSRALEFLTRAVELEPDQPDALLILGMAYTRDGQLDKARSALEAAALLRPEEPKAHYRLSQIYSRLGNTASAARETEIYQETMKKFREKNQRSVSLPSASRAAKQPDDK